MRVLPCVPVSDGACRSEHITPPPNPPNTVPGVRVAPNAEEVQAHKYVTQAELQAMMRADSGLLWSPWFR